MDYKKVCELFEKLKKINTIITFVGLLFFILVIIFDLAYPDILFTIFLVIGLGLIAIASIIWMAIGVFEVVDAFKIDKRQGILTLVVFLLIFGLIIYKLIK